MRTEILDALNEINEEEDQQLSADAQTHTRRKSLPDEGVYDCTFVESDAFTYDDRDTGERKLAVKLVFRVASGPKELLVMERTYWPGIYDRAELFDAVTILSGSTPTSTRQALEYVDGLEGKSCKCKVKKGISKNTGREWESLTLVGN